MQTITKNMIKEKIIEFILSIPIEKWNKMATEINEHEISFGRDMYGNATVVIRENGKRSGIVICSTNKTRASLNKLRDDLFYLSKKTDEEMEETEIKNLYERLTCKADLSRVDVEMSGAKFVNG